MYIDDKLNYIKQITFDKLQVEIITSLDLNDVEKDVCITELNNVIDQYDNILRNLIITSINNGYKIKADYNIIYTKDGVIPIIEWQCI